MNDNDTKDFLIGAIGLGTITVAGILVFHLFVPLLAIGAVMSGWNWYKRWRFKNLRKADKKMFIRLPGQYNTTELKPNMLYLGKSKDETIRYWYDDGYVYSQAVDDGKMYWDKAVLIRDQNLIMQLNGMQEMGNEWPAYYHEILGAEKRKAAKSKKKYAASATSEFLGEHPDYLKDLNETVDQLRKEVQGYCPVIEVKEEKK